MSKERCRVPDEILRELKLLGVEDWTVEPGRKHTLLRIGGQRVTVLPRGGGRQTGYVMRNVIASIRRVARGGKA